MLDIYSSLSLIWRYSYCPVFQGATSVENKISLNWSEVEKSWCAHVGGVMTDGCWCWDYDPDHHQDNINPLRAAMIVFLMMQDSANVPANSTGSDIR
ncbi:phage protein NinX family protein [Citrobacter portucalensis]|uniref:phage protein NinX family protein n=1 Tax=Citrobacter portucalensis TaxID=1639133 RepID=UPI00403446F2